MDSTHTNGERPSKRARLLLEDSASEGTDGENPADLNTNSQNRSHAKKLFKINTQYARRFEHNKKREELQRCSFPISDAQFHF